MPILSTSDWMIDYVEAGSGSPVLLLHSSVSGNRQWRSLMTALSDRYYVIAPVVERRVIEHRPVVHHVVERPVVRTVVRPVVQRVVYEPALVVRKKIVVRQAPMVRERVVVRPAPVVRERVVYR